MFAIFTSRRTINAPREIKTINLPGAVGVPATERDPAISPTCPKVDGKPAVFADRGNAETVKALLQRYSGFEVLDVAEVSGGEPLDALLASQIDHTRQRIAGFAVTDAALAERDSQRSFDDFNVRRHGVAGDDR